MSVDTLAPDCFRYRAMRCIHAARIESCSMGSASTLEYRFDMNAILLRCERWMRAAATARALADMSSADCPIVGDGRQYDKVSRSCFGKRAMRPTSASTCLSSCPKHLLARSAPMCGVTIARSDDTIVSCDAGWFAHATAFVTTCCADGDDFSNPRKMHPSSVSGMLSMSGCKSTPDAEHAMIGARHASGCSVSISLPLVARALPHATFVCSPSMSDFSNHSFGVRWKSMVRAPAGTMSHPAPAYALSNCESLVSLVICSSMGNKSIGSMDLIAGMPGPAFAMALIMGSDAGMLRPKAVASVWKPSLSGPVAHFPPLQFLRGVLPSHARLRLRVSALLIAADLCSSSSHASTSSAMGCVGRLCILQNARWYFSALRAFPTTPFPFLPSSPRAMRMRMGCVTMDL